MAQYIDKNALVAEIDKRLHQLTDAAFDSMIGRNLIEIRDFLNTLEVKEVEEEPVSKDYRERYKRIAQSESFKEAYDGKSISEEEPSEIDFEQELYNYFGQVKDFTLGMRIAKRFYDMGRKHQEPVSEELEAEIIRYIGYPQEVDEDVSTTMIRKAAHHFANWQKQQMMKDAVKTFVDFSMAHKLGVKEGSEVKLIIIKED